MTLLADAGRQPDVSGRGGVAVELVGVVHLYRQAGADVVGLRGVDLEVAAGEMLALLGPSGMGKTTVLRLMAGLMAASAGIVRVDGTDLGRLKGAERRRLRAVEISYIVQGTLPNVLPFATALENVWFAQHGAVREGRPPPWSPDELLSHLGLEEVADAPLNGLPRALQQAVAVAAGVAPGARLLLADEPTAQLTSTGAEGVVALLKKVNADFGTTVVIVTHDPVIADLFPRTVTIRDGRVGVEAHLGEEFAVVDGSGSVQLPPDALALLPPNSRVKVVVTPTRVELHPPEALP
ncbi:MAG: ATP-binding cassette domain-containing protein [Actinomycetota bacterium]|jgi:ABC-type lipoprotein export system ATPase subunit|nr:ATP-binding cassette domain-containing protein [Actinomycetota bacterium]